MFKRRRLKRLIRNMILDGIRKRYQTDVKAYTSFDRMVDMYLAFYFVAACNAFGINPRKVDTVQELLYMAYKKLDESKKPAEEDVGLIEWLNNHTFPMLYTLVRFNIDDHTQANIDIMEYIKLLIGNTVLNPINKDYSRSSLMLTSDYFVKILKSIITENVGEARVTGHDPVEPAAGLH